MNKQGRFFVLGPFRIVVIYATVSLLWIYFSDILLGAFVHDPQVITAISVFKGFFFVIITTTLLYFFIRRDMLRNSQRESALQESEQKYRRLHESMIDAFASVSMDSRLLEWNRAFREMVGYSDEELRHMSFTDFTPLKWHSQEAQIIKEQVLLRGYSDVYEKEYQRKDGSRLSVELKAFLIRDHQGKPESMWAIVRDITPRKRSEEALRSSERRFDQLLEHSLDNIVVLDTHGIQRFVSKSVVRTLGFQPDDLTNVPVMEQMIHPDDRKKVKEAFLQIITNGEGGPIQYRHRHKNGSWVDLEAWGTNQLNNPDIKGVVVNCRVITDRKKAEMAANLLKAIVESAEDCIISKDLDSVITSWNQGAEKMFGFTAGEMVGSSIMRLIPADRQQEETLILGQIKLGKVVGHFETVRQKKDGQLIDVSITASPIKDVEGMIIGASKVARDITERKRAGEMLKKKELQLRESQKLALLGSWDLDLTTQQISMSDETFALVDQSPATFSPSFEKFISLVHPDDRQILQTNLVQSLTSDSSPCHVVVRIINDSGRQWVMEIFGSVRRDKEGSPLSIYGSVQDISERLQVQEALKLAKEEAEAANRYKTEFLTNISHDLRTPLNAILGFAHILKSVEMEPKYRKSVDFINQRGQHLLAMVEAILHVSRMDSSMPQLKHEEFDLSLLLADSVEVSRVALGAKDVKVSINIGTLPCLKGDALRVRQIIDNLLNNAVKYTLKGQIDLTVRFDQQPSDQGKHRLEISVKDTGFGISAEQLPYIFDSFTRFHEFYKGQTYDGVGLGLHIVKKLVDLMGGQIRVLSQIDQGSEFIVTLNLDKA